MYIYVYINKEIYIHIHMPALFKSVHKNCVCVCVHLCIFSYTLLPENSYFCTIEVSFEDSILMCVYCACVCAFALFTHIHV